MQYLQIKRVIKSEKKVMLFVSVDPPAAGTVVLSHKEQLFPSLLSHLNVISLAWRRLAELSWTTLGFQGKRGEIKFRAVSPCTFSVQSRLAVRKKTKDQILFLNHWIITFLSGFLYHVTSPWNLEWVFRFKTSFLYSENREFLLKSWCLGVNIRKSWICFWLLKCGSATFEGF